MAIRLNYSTADARQESEKFRRQHEGDMGKAQQATRVFGDVAKITFGIVSAQAVGTFARALGNAVQRAQELQPVAAGFDTLTTKIGSTSDAMLRRLRPATQGMISDFDLMKQANNAIILGVAQSDEQYASLADAAVRLGRAVGLDAAGSIDSLTVGIGRQSRMMLDNLGVIVSATEAQQRYADKIGVSASALTDEQKKLAFTEEATRKVMEAADALGEVHVSSADRVQAYSTGLGNARDQMIMSLNDSAALSESLGNLFDASDQDRARTYADLIGVAVAEALAVAIQNVDEMKDSFTEMWDAALDPQKLALLEQLVKGLFDFARSREVLGIPLPPGMTESLRAALEAIRGVNNALDDNSMSSTEAYKAGQEYAKQLAIQYGLWEDNTEATDDNTKSVKKSTAEVGKAVDIWKQWAAGWDYFNYAASDRLHPTLELVRLDIQGVRADAFSAALALDQLNQITNRFNRLWSQAGGGGGGGGGGFFDGLFGGIKDRWAGLTDGKGFTGFLGFLGGSIGDAAFSVLSGGISSLINAGLGALGGLLGGFLFGERDSIEKRFVQAGRDLAWLGGASDALKQKIAELAYELKDNLLAQLKLLPDIAKEAAENMQGFERVTNLASEALRRGMLSEVEGALPHLLSMLDDMDEMGRQAWRGFIEGAREAGAAIEGLDAHVEDMLTGMAGDLIPFLDRLEALVQRRTLTAIGGDGQVLNDGFFLGPTAGMKGDLRMVLQTLEVGIAEGFAQGFSASKLREIFGDQVERAADLAEQFGMEVPRLVEMLEWLGTHRMETLSTRLDAASSIIDRMLKLGLTPLASQIQTLEKSLRQNLRQLLDRGGSAEDVMLLYGPQIRQLLEMATFIPGFQIGNVTRTLLESFGLDVDEMIEAIDAQNINDDTLNYYDRNLRWQERIFDTLIRINGNIRGGPRFATGGIVNGPTWAMVGEAGPEEIRPIGSRGSDVTVTVRQPASRGGGMAAVVDAMMSDPSARTRMLEWIDYGDNVRVRRGT